jgi:hypothetical protein
MRTLKPAPTVAAGLLRMARLERGLTQRELAGRAGVAQAVIATIESGRRQPTIPTLQRILAGAGLELRFRLEAIDDHDRVLEERRRQMPPAVAAVVDRRHRENVELFSANAPTP